MITRPVARLDPYSTPNPAIFLCSAATPPGGGVHGLCGYLAARSVAGKCFGHALQKLVDRPYLDGINSSTK
jgi:hypothetical protein